MTKFPGPERWFQLDVCEDFFKIANGMGEGVGAIFFLKYCETFMSSVIKLKYYLETCLLNSTIVVGLKLGILLHIKLS